MATMCIISVITSPPLPLDVLSACSTNWCTCMSSRIRILKAFSSEIKSHRCFYPSTRSCYGISVFYNLLWFCFIKVTVRVTFKFIHLERFRLGADEDLGNFFVTEKSDNRTGRWRRQGYWFVINWSGWTLRAAIWKRKLAPCSSFWLLVHSWWKSACFVFCCLASNGSLPHWSVMFCSFFHGDFQKYAKQCWLCHC